MKKFLILFAMAVMCSIAMAQSETTRTIHGAVVDKNGNPLPGAVVSATDGAETALVNADGTFELEIPIWLKSVTASYAGYKNKKMKPRFDRDMIFRLKKKNNRYGFLNAFGGVAIYDDKSAPEMGLMGGMLGNVGFYLKAGILIDNSDYYYDSDGSFYKSGSDTGTFTAIAGVTKRIYKNIYAYLGVGYSGVLNDVYNYNYHEDYLGNEYYSAYKESPYLGMAFDGGFIFGIGRHFNVSVGYTHTTDFDGYWNLIPNLSLGYVF